VLGQAPQRAVRPILAAAVRMHAQPRRGLPLAEGHGQCLGRECRPHVVGHEPADDRSRAPIQHHGERQPAFAGRKGGALSALG
jgi:hypothetical protein